MKVSAPFAAVGKGAGFAVPFVLSSSARFCEAEPSSARACLCAGPFVLAMPLRIPVRGRVMGAC